MVLYSVLFFFYSAASRCCKSSPFTFISSLHQDLVGNPPNLFMSDVGNLGWTDLHLLEHLLGAPVFLGQPPLVAAPAPQVLLALRLPPLHFLRVGVPRVVLRGPAEARWVKSALSHSFTTLSPQSRIYRCYAAWFTVACIQSHFRGTTCLIINAEEILPADLLTCHTFAHR